MSEDPYAELVNECYICFDPCSKQSPCNCNTFVHPKCLQKYIKHSGSTSCEICLATYPEKKKCCQDFFAHRSLTFVIITFFAFYTITGITGQLIIDEITHNSIEIKPPWHLKHILAAIIISSLIYFAYAFVKRTRMLV